MQQHHRLLLLAIIILLVGCSVGCIGSTVNANSGAATTVILIRHVERNNFFIVTAQGHERARALVDAVGDMGIVAIYSPDLERNLDTVRPLSKQLGVAITLIPRISKKTVRGIIHIYDPGSRTG